MSPDDEALFDALREQASTGERVLVDASWRLDQLSEENDSLRAELDMLRGDSAILNSMSRANARGVMGAELARHYIGAAAADGAGWLNLKAQAEAECRERVEAMGIDVDKWAADTKAKAVAAMAAREPPAKPPTVADLLRVLPVAEWRDGAGWWRQTTADGSSRCWRPGVVRWSPWDDTIDEDDESRPARLVPASEADADPATRGPIGGGA